MKYSIYLTNNNESTINKLESLGFKICPCCKFPNVMWLHFHYRNWNVKEPIKEFHGAGNGCENDCFKSSLECITCAIKESIKYGYEVHIFNNIDNMINFINSVYIMED